MKRTFAEAMAHRRSYYSIGSDSSVLDEEIVHIIREAVKNVPSAFNSQSTRIVLLLGNEHKKLWNIVKETLKARISAEAFAKTEAKIDGCFASGHGTVLYFEDTSVVKKLQEAFPHLVTAYLRYAPVCHLDYAGRYGVGRLPATL